MLFQVSNWCFFFCRVAGEYCENLQELCVKDCQNVTESSLKRIRDLKVKVDIAPWSQETIRNLQFGVFHLPAINLQIWKFF